MNKIINVLFSVIFLNFSAWAQSASGSSLTTLTLSEIALIDIEPNNSPISIGVSAPVEAGNPISTTTVSNTKWINYTSAVPTGSSRNIAVQVSSGTIPTGVNLAITASSFSGSGAGATGTPTGSVNLSGSPQTIIAGIGGAFTGNGINNGHSLTYSLSIGNISLLQQNSSSTVTVTFTLIDN